jgi:cytoskeleton protein RodZ
MAKLSQPYMVPDDSQDPQEGSGGSWNSARDGVAGLLAKRRDALGWNLHDIADTLRIRVEYLAALEAGSLEGLPGPAYAMGFLRAYADYLGFDGKDIVRRFKAEQTSLNAKPELTFPMPLTERGIPGSGLLLTAIILLGLGYGTWYYLSSDKGASLPQVEQVPAQLLPKVASTPAPKPPEAAMKPVAPPTPAVSPAAATPATPAVPPATVAMPAATPPVAAPVEKAAAPLPAPDLPKAAPVMTAQAPTPSPPPATTPVTPSAATTAPAAAGRIVIVATAQTWFQLSENEKPIVTKMLEPGQSYPVPDRPGLTLWTGNAGGMHLVVDGKELPPPGRVGEAKRHIRLEADSLASTLRH